MDMVTRRLPSARAPHDAVDASYDDREGEARPDRPAERRASREEARTQCRSSIRPGDVLADRYLLVDLLSESGDGRFWRAHDRILDRHVAVHVIGGRRRAGRRPDGGRPALGDRARPADPAGPRRRPARRRLLRRQRVGLGHLARHPGRQRGPARPPPGGVDRLRGRRLDRDRPRGRGRARPAGPRERPDRPERVGPGDRLLRRRRPARPAAGPDVHRRHRPRPASSTSCSPRRWPGVSRSDVPAAPHDDGRVLRPRQVRAGVPRPLDTLCDQVLNLVAAAGDLATARGRLRGAAGVRRRLDRDGGRRGRPPDGATAPPGPETRLLPLVPPEPGRAHATPDPVPPTPEPSRPGRGGNASPRRSRRRLRSTSRPRPGCRSSTTTPTTCPGSRRGPSGRRRRPRRSRSRPSGRCSRPTPRTAQPGPQAAARRRRTPAPASTGPGTPAPAPAPASAPAAASSR